MTVAIAPTFTLVKDASTSSVRQIAAAKFTPLADERVRLYCYWIGEQEANETEVSLNRSEAREHFKRLLSKGWKRV